MNPLLAVVILFLLVVFTEQWWEPYWVRYECEDRIADWLDERADALDDLAVSFGGRSRRTRSPHRDDSDG